MHYLYLKNFCTKKSGRNLAKTYQKRRILKVGIIPSHIVRLYNCKFHSRSIFITTKVLSHIYERRKSFLYNILLPNIEDIVRKPDIIYENNKKEFGLIIVKQIDKQEILLVLNYVKGLKPRGYYIVTSFIGRQRYIQKLKRL